MDNNNIKIVGITEINIDVNGKDVHCSCGKLLNYDSSDKRYEKCSAHEDERSYGIWETPGFGLRFALCSGRVCYISNEEHMKRISDKCRTTKMTCGVGGTYNGRFEESRYIIEDEFLQDL